MATKIMGKINDKNIAKWDVSNIVNFEKTFYECKNFNQDISKWNTSKATNMENMLFACEKFNQDLSEWNVANVKKYFQFASDTPIEGTNKVPKFV